MSCATHSGTSAVLRSAIPSALKQVSITSLSKGQDCSQIFIQGRVKTKWPFQRINPRRCLLKIILVEDTDAAAGRSPTISVFLTGEYAEHCQNIEVKDTLCVNDFFVEDVTSSDGASCSCQVILDKQRTPAALWVLKHTPQAGPSTASTFTDPGPQAVSPTKGRTYTYTPLADLKDGSVVNVYGVVKFWKPIAKTRGTDYSCMVSLIDPSLENNDQRNKLKCLLFARDKERLPRISKLGEIVRFHRLKITTFRDELQGQCTPGFSWILFDGEVGGSMEPHTSLSTYTITQEDKDKVTALRIWSASDGQQLYDQDPVPNDETFAGMVPAAYFNIVVQVVAVYVLEPGVALLMRVWDGTQSAYPVFEVTTSDGTSVGHSDARLTAQAKGYIYDVCAFDDHFAAACRVKPGDYVRFTNLHAMLHKKDGNNDIGYEHDIVPTLEICLHKGTSYNRGMAILGDNDVRLGPLKARLEKIIAETPITVDDASQEDPGATGNDGIDTTNSGESQVSRKFTFRALDKTNVSPTRGGGRCAEGNAAGPSSVSSSNHRGQSGGADGVTSPARKRQRTLDGSSSSSIVEAPGGEDDRCMQCTATVTVGHRHIKRTMIGDMLSHEAPHKFRIKARVQDYQPKPQTALQLIHLHCPSCHYTSPVPEDVRSVPESEDSLDESLNSLPPGQWANKAEAFAERDGLKRYLCPQCRRSSPRKTRQRDKPPELPELQFVIMLRFLLEDGSGWCLAQLWKDEAESFFHDQKAEELLRDSEAVEALLAALKRLCPRPGASEDSPWIECFVQSFTTKSGVSYQIFKTMLSLDESQY